MDKKNGYATINNDVNSLGKEIIRENEIIQNEVELYEEKQGVYIAEFQPIFKFSSSLTLEYPKGPYYSATTEFYLPNSVYLNKDFDFVIQFWGGVHNPKNLEFFIKVNNYPKISVFSIDKWEYIVSPIRRIPSSQFQIGKNSISVILGGGSGKFQLGHGILIYNKLETIS